MAIALVLGACGGGGGSSGIPVFPAAGVSLPAAGGPPEAGASIPPAGSGGAGASTVSGAVSFDSVPNPTGRLVYGGVVSKPVRGATVEIVGADQTVLATSVTDDRGTYSASVPVGQEVFVRVRASLQKTGTDGAWDVTVRDNTQGDAIYALQTPTFPTGVGAIQKNLSAPSGWDGNSYTTTRSAAPFAILDDIYTAQAKVRSVAPAIVFPPLKLFWSVNNVPASGDANLGQIGTTSFTKAGQGRAIYVLGKADVDTDEYDESVVTHEWGHYYQSAFSRDDSVGGEHGPGDRLDRRVAFSEGWGNAWSGIALARGNYTDSFGAGQAVGANIDLTVGASVNKGWFSESSIQYALWTLDQAVGFGAIHAVMTGPLKNSLPVTSIHLFNAALKAIDPVASAALTPLLGAEGINPLADAWGVGETNNGGLPIALPMYLSLTPGIPITNACVSNQIGASRGDNKLGNYAYIRFAATVATRYQISIAGADAATDPDFRLYGPGGPILEGNTSAPGRERQNVSLLPGEYVLAVTDYQNTSPSTCFTVAVTAN